MHGAVTAYSDLNMPLLDSPLTPNVASSGAAVIVFVEAIAAGKLCRQSRICGPDLGDLFEDLLHPGGELPRRRPWPPTCMKYTFG